jgi:hypothetical protein
VSLGDKRSHLITKPTSDLLLAAEARVCCGAEPTHDEPDEPSMLRTEANAT